MLLIVQVLPASLHGALLCLSPEATTMGGLDVLSSATTKGQPHLSLLCRHSGAKHKGAWSRLDLQSNPGGYARAAITKLTGTIPAAAHATYFRDEIGNISSSNIRCATGARHCVGAVDLHACELVEKDPCAKNLGMTQHRHLQRAWERDVKCNRLHATRDWLTPQAEPRLPASPVWCSFCWLMWGAPRV